VCICFQTENITEHRRSVELANTGGTDVTPRGF